MQGYIRADEAHIRRARLPGDTDRRHRPAAALGAECFVLVVGSLPDGSRDLPRARAEVEDGIAAQFSETNGFFRRGPLKWTARATSSLPVPLSPVIRTGAELSVTLSTRLRIVSILGERVMIEL